MNWRKQVSLTNCTGCPDESADAECLDGIQAHNLWLSFLLEQWELAKTEPNTLAYSSIYGRLLQHSLSDPSALTHHPAAVGARFRLLMLGLRYCTMFANREKEYLPASIMYQRVIRAGLAWYEPDKLCPSRSFLF